jgi:cbb3-type cytochrome oxidase maturation protein
MSSLAILIPVSLGMGLVGLCAFFWAVRADQFEDLEGNAWRVIAPEDPQPQDTPPETEGKQCDALADRTDDRDPTGRL